MKTYLEESYLKFQSFKVKRVNLSWNSPKSNNTVFSLSTAFQRNHVVKLGYQSLTLMNLDPLEVGFDQMFIIILNLDIIVSHNYKSDKM